MANSKQPDLVSTLEDVALAKYGELLAPELANSAAKAFASESAEMIQDLLEDSAAALRERIEGQLEALTGGGLGKVAKKKKKPSPAPKAEVKVAPKVEADEAAVEVAAAPAPKKRSRAKAS